jgi:hypothetical protein
MAFDVTGLNDYIAANPQIVLQNVILAGRSFELLRTEEDIKSSKKVLEQTSSDINFQTGDYSGYEGFEGDDAFKELEISVVPLHVKKAYRKNQIEETIIQVDMKQGSDPEDIPTAVTNAIMDLNGKNLVYNNELLVWQGDTTITGTTNLNKFNGIVKQVKAGIPVKTGTAPIGLTTTNAIAKVEEMVDTMEDNFPEFNGIETHLYMSPKNFSTYNRTVHKSNLALDANTIDQKPVLFLRVEGTNVIAQSMPGLSGSDEMILTRPDNFIIGTDLKSEADSINLDYNPFARRYELFALWKLGTKVVRPYECVIAGV